MSVIDDLEDAVGYEIEKSKQLHVISNMDEKFLDELDSNVYNFFINIKTAYN